MQILDIILYGEAGKRRILSFDPGKVNIITGDSKTGKTAIIDIVDYCLGSGDFKVAEGIVRDYVLWYAVRYQLKQGQLLVARPNPSKDGYTKSAVLLLQADKIEIPSFEELKPNINDETLLLKLSNIIGIEEYKHQAEGLTRPDTPVTFKHSRYYCFQPQTDIDQRDFLFYNQKKEFWVEQSMKDTLPYFLGAVANENIKLERQLAEKRRNLNRLEREIKELQAISEQTNGKVFDLITEAKQVGLVPLENIVKDREEGLKLLQVIVDSDIIGEEQDLGNDALIDIQSKVQELIYQRSSIIENIKAAESYQKEAKGYESEGQQQITRLESINLFSNNGEVNNSVCPLCNQTLENPTPTIQQINESLIGLKKNIDITKKEEPRLKEYLNDLYQQKRDISNQIKTYEEGIKSIYAEQDQAKKIKDLNIRKGRILGRVGLYLESRTELADFSYTKQVIEELKKDINYLQQQLSSEEKEERLENILDQLSVQMTNWSQELELEFKDRTIKFSIKKLTLFIISTGKIIRFDQTGSGENWVAYHLLIHFALHKYFVLNDRPVPNFLILDQLSQAYFPPEKDINGTGEIEQSEDDKAIKRLFDFVFERTDELGGKFQTIIIDHANLKEERFQNSIKEEWRNGIKLVPIDWINSPKLLN